MHEDHPRRLIGDFQAIKIQVTHRAGLQLLSIELLSLKSQTIYEINIGLEFIKSDEILCKCFTSLKELKEYLDYEFPRLETTDNGDIIFNVQMGLKQIKVVLPAQRREKSDLQLCKKYTDRLLNTKIQQLTKLFDIRLQQLQHSITQQVIQFDRSSQLKMKIRIDSRITQLVSTLQAFLTLNQDIKMTQGKFEVDLATLNRRIQTHESEIEGIRLKVSQAEARVRRTSQQLKELLNVIQRHVDKQDQQKNMLQKEVRLINKRLNVQLNSLSRKTQEVENTSLQNKAQRRQQLFVKKQIIAKTYEDIFYELLSVDQDNKTQISELLISAAVQIYYIYVCETQFRSKRQAIQSNYDLKKQQKFNYLVQSQAELEVTLNTYRVILALSRRSHQLNQFYSVVRIIQHRMVTMYRIRKLAFNRQTTNYFYFTRFFQDEAKVICLPQRHQLFNRQCFDVLVQALSSIQNLKNIVIEYDVQLKSFNDQENWTLKLLQLADKNISVREIDWGSKTMINEVSKKRRQE